MKKIITSLGMLVFVGAVVAGGTGAFFSDTETSTGNVFTAGAIDLKIDNSSYGFDWNDPENDDPTGEWGQNTNNSWQLSDLTEQLFFNFHDLKPGDYGEDTISIHVNNNDAYACMALDLTGTPENEQNEPEAEVDNTAGADEGELQNYLSFLFWHDDGDNVLEDGEQIIDELSGLSSDIFTGDWLALAESGDTPLVGGETSYIGKGWCFGDISPAPVTPDNYGAPTADNTGFSCTGAEGNHNDAQTDGITVDVAFHAVQARHNEEFRCASLPKLGGDDETSVKVWTDEGTRTGGVAEIVEIDGVGSVLELTTIDDVDSRVRYNLDVDDIRLDTFTGFSYDSNQVSAFDLVNGNASFRLVVDLDGVTTKEITFEPYYNIFAHNNLNAPAIVPSIWQTWAANLSNGKFWVNGLLIDGKDSSGGGSYAANFTLNQLLAEYPDAEIVGISIGMGTYNKDQVVQVDNLIFNGANLGF